MQLSAISWELVAILTSLTGVLRRGLHQFFMQSSLMLLLVLNLISALADPTRCEALPTSEYSSCLLLDRLRTSILVVHIYRLNCSR